MRLLSPAAVQYFSSFSVGWRPFAAERPSIRARVISPSGAEHVLDPSTVVDVAGDRGEGDVLTDLRKARAPLPGVERGAVVEIMLVLTEREAIPGAGLHAELSLAPPRTRRSSVVVDAPAGLPLRHAFRGAGPVPAPEETTAGGRRRLAWRWNDLPDRPEREPDEPDGDTGTGLLTISTARSWAAVAEAYRTALARQEASAELAALAREITAGATGRDAHARRILDWMASRLRYTGLALGLAALVPVEPGEVLRRRYGDCKDLALVFASMMRALGHEADLALVRADPVDLDPQLPGIGAFNHAVARVAGERPLWIDATVPDLPVGEVPSVLEEHAALVIRPGVAALERIPANPPGPATVFQEFEVRLVESGPAEVRETGTLAGMSAASERRRGRLASPEQLAKVLAEEQKERLRADEASAEILSSEPGRIAYRGKGTGSAWGSATDDTAEARLQPRALRCAPDPLLPWLAAGEGERKAPLRVARPCRREARHRVVVASGLRPSGPLPEAIRLAEGPLRFEASFEATGDGGVSARYRLDLDRGLLTADQVGRIRKALRPLGAEGPLVEFRRASLDLLEAGKGREALDEIRRLIAAEPSEVGHQIRLALALHRLGLGAAARAAARRAVETAPGSGWAHRILEIVLESDLLGRRLEPGCDLAGAIAAQRRAVALEPGSRRTRAYLGGLLLHGDRCVYFGGGADPAEAASVLGAIPDLDEVEGAPEDLMHAFLGLGRDREAVALARKRPAGLRRDAALLAGLALSEGLEAAVTEAGRLPPADRGEASRVASLFVARRREYRLAGDLLERGSAGAADAARYQATAHWLQRASHLDSGPPRTPEALAGALAQAGAGLRPLEPLLAKARGPGELQTPRALAEALVESERLYGPPQVVAEVAAAAPLRWEPAGGDAGRLHIGDRQVFLLREADGWKLLAVLGENAILAERALTLLEAGRIDDARRWLAWATGGSVPPSFQATLIEPLIGGSGGPPDGLRLLAAALSAGRRGDGAIEVLEAARARPLPPAARQAVLTLLAAVQVDVKRPEEAIAAADEVLREAPRSLAARTVRIQALGELGRLDELRRLLDLARREVPADPELLRWLYGGAVRGRDHALAVAALESVSLLPQATPNDLNNLAWTRLFLEGPLTVARGEAQRAVQASGGHEAHLHTLATVLAANGEPAQAMEALTKAADRRGWTIAADWLVVGRVAEAYGLPEEAREAYRKVEEDDGDALSPRILAQRWLTRLEQGPAR